MDGPHFVYSFIDGYLGCFYPFCVCVAIVNNATVDTSVRPCFLFFLVYNHKCNCWIIW